MKDCWELNGAAAVLPYELRRALEPLEESCIGQVEELRLRRGIPMTVTCGGKEQETGSPPVTEAHLLTVLENASQASAHTVLDQIRHGFVTLRGGHRIGLCGTVSRKNGEITTMRYLSSLSVRIARPVRGIADQVLPALIEEGELRNTLILAPPGVGKTTLLRDVIRVLSNGGTRVGVADERGEIAALWQGQPQFDVGRQTDVLDGCAKAEGMSILLRGMNPQVLAVDEITDPADVGAMQEACGCGVALLATAHGSEIQDLKRRPLYRNLLEQRVFQRVVVLDRRDSERRMKVEVLP